MLDCMFNPMLQLHLIISLTPFFIFMFFTFGASKDVIFNLACLIFIAWYLVVVDFCVLIGRLEGVSGIAILRCCLEVLLMSLLGSLITVGFLL